MTFESFASSSAANLYTVTDDFGRRLAIECGMSLKQMRVALGFDLTKLDGVLLSHSHDDHARAALDIMRVGAARVYASRRTLLDVLGGPGLHAHMAVELRPGTVQEVGSFHVLPFETVHDSPGSLGFIVMARRGSALMYACDTSHVPLRFKGLTHIAVECNFALDLLRESSAEHRTRVVKNHMSLERVIETLRETDLSKVREIHLLHLSDAHSDAERFRREVEAATGKPVHVAPKWRKA